MNKPRALLLASTALVATGMLAGAGLDHIGAQRARGLADRLGLVGGSIEADARAGRIVLRDASLPLGAAHVRIGALTLQGQPFGFDLIGAAQAQTAATARDIVVVWPFGTYRIPAIEAQGANISGADFAALFDPRAPAPLSERLARLNAAAIVAPEVIAEAKVGDQTQKLVYKDMKLTNIVGGRAALATLSGASMSTTNAEIGDMQAVYGPMSVKALDMPLIARFATEKARPGEARAPIYADFTLDGFRMSAAKPGFEMRVGKISGGGVKARPLTQGLPALLAFAEKGAEAKKTPGAPQPDPREGAALVTDMFDAMEIGAIEATGFEGAGKDKDGKPVSVALARMAFSGFASARLGEMAYEGLKVSSEEAKVSLGVFALRDLDLSNTLKTASNVAQGDPMALKNPRDAIPTLGQILIGGLDVDVVARDGKGNAANGARNKLQLGKFDLTAGNYLSGIPTKLGWAIEKLVFDLPADVRDPKLKQLAALGLKRIDVSNRVAAAWDAAKQELSLDDASFEGDKLGVIRLSLLAGNVDKGLFSGNAAMAQAAALGAVLKKLDLAVKDTGLLGLVLALGAKEQGKTAEQLRSEYVSAAAVGIPALLGNHPSAKALGSAVSKFLAQPKNLRINVVSRNGVGASDVAVMQSPADILSKIEIRAVANE